MGDPYKYNPRVTVLSYHHKDDKPDMRRLELALMGNEKEVTYRLLLNGHDNVETWMESCKYIGVEK